MKISRVWWSGLGGGSGLMAVLAMAVFAIGCGDVFRPVAVPIAGPPGDPQPTSFAFSLSQNSPATAGSILQINVPGDSAVFSTPTGLGPVHAAFLPPGESRIYVANRDDDTVTTYLPSLTSQGATVLNLPSGSKPVFLATTETSKMYVANAGSNSVGVIDGVQSALITTVAVGIAPVALAETADGKKVYAVNQGSANLSVIDTGSDTVVNTIPVGTSPIWALLSPDRLELYVLNQGSGTVSIIDTTSDTVVASLAVGTSPVHMVVDKQLNRLYVVNNGSNTISIFDASVDPPTPLRTVVLPVSAPPPISIAVLPNGSKVYVPGQQITGPVLDPVCPLKGKPCQLAVVSIAVIDTTNNTVSRTVSAKSPVLESVDPVTQQQIPLLCNPGNVAFTQTGGVRFPVFATASSNSNRVYISSCDAGVIHVLNTANDSFVTDLASPISSFAPLTSTTPPPPQQPVFVLPGP